MCVCVCVCVRVCVCVFISVASPPNFSNTTYICCALSLRQIQRGKMHSAARRWACHGNNSSTEKVCTASFMSTFTYRQCSRSLDSYQRRHTSNLQSHRQIHVIKYTHRANNQREFTSSSLKSHQQTDVIKSTHRAYNHREFTSTSLQSHTRNSLIP